MRIGFIVSLIGHVIVVASAFASVVSTQSVGTTETIPVELVQIEKSTAESPPKDRAAQPAKPEQPMSEATAAPPSPTTPASAPPATKTLGLASSGRPTTLTREELDGLIAQARRCWSIPAAWTDPRQVSVTIRFRLNKDGTLDGKPDVVEFAASQLGKISADNAARAVAQCGPYHLPPDKYDQWSDVQLRFTPGR
jgi:hypothetical protein